MNSGFIELQLENSCKVSINVQYIVSFQPNILRTGSGSCISLVTGESLNVEESCSDIKCKIADSQSYLSSINF